MNPDATSGSAAGESACRLRCDLPAVRWNEFVRDQIATPLWHLAEWDRPLAVYGLKLQRLAAERDNQIVGVLPVVAQRSLLFGNRLVSLPWVDSSGMICATEGAQACLVQGALDQAAQSACRDIVLRQSSPVRDWPVERDDKIAMQLQLEDDPERLWKRFDPKVRNQVRKAEKSGVTTETLTNGGTAEFYDVYSENMRDLGSPAHSARFFSEVAAAFPEAVQIHLARVEGQIAGAGLTMKNGTRLDIPWASSRQQFNRLCVNHALYWHMLRGACQAGFQSFYFGRSTRDSGQHHFKKQWGATEVPLYWYRLDRSGKCHVDTRPPQESFGLAIRIWRRLPLALSRWIGPRVISRLS